MEERTTKELDVGRKYKVSDRFEFYREDDILVFRVPNVGIFKFNPLGYMLDMHAIRQLHPEMFQQPIDQLPPYKLTKGELQDSLEIAVNNQDFEEAARLRDKIKKYEEEETEKED